MKILNKDSERHVSRKILREVRSANTQFLVFKPRSYCFKETMDFDVKVSFARRPVSSLIKPGDITKKF